MKIKIKGLVFAGAAAAIMLSAGGAYAAKSTAGRSTNGTLHGVTENMGNPGVVTSEKYTKAEYEWVKNKVDGSTWTATVSNADARAALIDDDYYPSTATMATAIAEVAADLETTREITGDGDYTYVTTVDASGTEGQAGYVPAHKEVGIIDANLVKAPANVVAANADKLTTASAVQPQVTAVGTESAAANGNTPASTAVVQVGWKGSGQNDTGTWQSLDGSGYVMIETDNSGTDPVQHVRLRADSVHTTNDVANNDTINTVGNASKLATAGTVQIKQSAANKYQVSSNQEWTDVSNAVTELSGGYADVVATATGGVTIDIDANKITTAGANITDTGNTASNLTTAKAVAEYVASTGLGGIELPAMNDDCSKTDSHCSLVTSWNDTSHKIEAAWVVMAGAAGTGSNHTTNGVYVP